jgi:hypothetical protein
LALLCGVLLWLAGLSLGGACRVLRRLGVRYRRGREHLRSPDPDYDRKMAVLARCREGALADPKQLALLYSDEFTFYRRPSLAQAYGQAGRRGPPAEQGHRRNTKRRLIGSLDARLGRAFFTHRAKAGADELAAHYRGLGEAYPGALIVWVAVDNWSVHFHPKVQRALRGTNVRLLRLPTYAPWANPVEKVWRKLRQEVLHMHAFADDWEGLKAEVDGWLARQDRDRAALLRYVGLLAPE